MKIVTGLVPAVNLSTYPRRFEVETMYAAFAEDAYVRLVAPELATVDMWTLSFSTPSDSVAAPAGQLVSVMLLRSEPKIEKRELALNLPDDLPANVAADYEAFERRKHCVPADAFVSDRRKVPFATERGLLWWEVTA